MSFSSSGTLAWSMDHDPIIHSQMAQSRNTSSRPSALSSPNSGVHRATSRFIIPRLAPIYKIWIFCETKKKFTIASLTSDLSSDRECNIQPTFYNSLQPYHTFNFLSEGNTCGAVLTEAGVQSTKSQTS